MGCYVNPKNGETTAKAEFTKEDIGKEGYVYITATYADGNYYRSSMPSDSVYFTVQ